MNCPQCGYDNYAGEEVCQRCLHDLTHTDTEPRPKSAMHRSIVKDPVSRLSPPPHVVCGPDDPVADVIEQMKSSRIGCVVVEKNRLPVGIFSERDIVMKIIGKPVDPARTPIRGLMTSPVESVKAGDTIAYVLNKMSIGGYRHVPIADANGHVSGVLSVRNILQYLAKQLA